MATAVGALSSAAADPSGLASGYDLPADFSIDATTGAVSYTGSSAPVGEFTLYAQVSDGRSPTSTADASIDDTATVTVTAANLGPSFGAESYAFSLAVGSDGSVNPVAVGAVAATDPENDHVTHSLRDSDASNAMYMLGGLGDALYSLNRTSSAATRIAATAAFGVSETDPRGLAWHNGELYMVGGATQALYTVDIATGEAVLAATLAQITGGKASVELSGVVSHNGALYVTTITTGALFRVDLDGPSGTQLGADDFGAVGETTPAGIASHGSTLYMVGGATDKLYTLDASTGAAVAVSVSTTNFGAVNERDPRGLTSAGALST